MRSMQREGTNMNLIGFNGGMGVGKSTAIQCLKDILEDTIYTNTPPVKLVKFAQPLYDIQEFVYRRVEPVYSRPRDFTKDRKLLQWIGTEWGRDGIDDELWVKLWTAEVLRIQSETPNAIVVCDDVRFDNEAAVLMGLGGVVVKISSTEAEKRIDTKSGIVQHKSEAGINKTFIYREVENNGTRLEFLNNLTEMYRHLGVTPQMKGNKNGF